MGLTVQTHLCISNTRETEVEDLNEPFPAERRIKELTLHTKHCGCHRALRAEM